LTAESRQSLQEKSRGAIPVGKLPKSRLDLEAWRNTVAGWTGWLGGRSARSIVVDVQGNSVGLSYQFEY